MAPILQTERLFLEELTQARFEDLAELLANEKVHRFFPKALSREEAADFLERVQQRQRCDGMSFWAVVRKGDGAFLGICGLLKQTIDGTEEVEVAYRLNDRFWGMGYATEAAAGCMRHAREVLGVSTLISLILAANKPSIRVAERNGLALDRETLFHGQVHQVYRHSLEAQEGQAAGVTPGLRPS